MATEGVDTKHSSLSLPHELIEEEPRLVAYIDPGHSEELFKVLFPNSTKLQIIAEIEKYPSLSYTKEGLYINSTAIPDVLQTKNNDAFLKCVLASLQTTFNKVSLNLQIFERGNEARNKLHLQRSAKELLKRLENLFFLMEKREFVAEFVNVRAKSSVRLFPSFSSREKLLNDILRTLQSEAVAGVFNLDSRTSGSIEESSKEIVGLISRLRKSRIKVAGWKRNNLISTLVRRLF